MEKKIIVIGIAGRTAAGKSTVREYIKKMRDRVLAIDADSVAKDIYEKDKSTLVKLKKTFGEDIFDKDGKLIYSALADKVFSDRGELKKLNHLMFPLMREEIENIIRNAKDRQYIVIDAAVLFNCRLDLLCDWIILVNAGIDLRKNYLKNKNLPENDIELRIKGQHIDIDQKKVDFTIENTGTKKDLYKQVENILNIIEA
jgi:dephospho-CoA kinase